ncbi:MAG: TolC family protein, partial [Calothrix sp. SM1_5_4]|nr:TolC family protein [Calothrix sp. SM1_5_4]
AGVNESAPEIKSDDHIRKRILDLQFKEAEYEAKLVARDTWPQVTLSAEYGYHNRDYLDTATTWTETQRWEWAALLTLKYTIFDFGMKKRNLEIAHVRAKKTKEENSQALLDLSNELRDVWLKLREFRENVKMSRELLVLEQQSYSILEAEYRNGRASYLDLITNLNSLIDARSKFMSSYFGLKKQQMLYSFHKGELHAKVK